MSQECPIHKSSLIEDQVVIIYGLVRYPKEYLEAQEKLFPCAEMIRLGGCIGNEPVFAEVNYCESCREVLVKWNQEKGTQYGLPPTNIDDYLKFHYSRLGKSPAKRRT